MTTLRDQILDFLRSSAGRVTTREVASRVRARGVRCDDHQVGAVLDSLLRERVVVQERAGWRLIGGPSGALSQAHTPSVWVPGSVADAGSGGLAVSPLPAAPLAARGTSPAQSASRWSLFRRLLRYYIDCVVQAERPSLRGFLDSCGEQWLFVRQPVPWDRLAQGQHGFSVILSTEEAAFHRNRLRAGPDESIYLGYPVDVVRPKAHDPWVVPLFVQPFRADMRRGVMHLTPTGPVTVNGAWLEGRFMRSADRDGFLRAVGLLGEEAEPDEGDAPATGAAPVMSFAELAGRAMDFVGDGVVEPIRPSILNTAAHDRAPKPGIHNRAVLVLGPRLTYTKGLIRELTNIGRWSDDELDRTALRWVFPHDSAPDVGASWPVPQPICDLAPEMVASMTILSSGQRRAVEHALCLPGLVVTGPPGTGKSELVATILANQLLRGRSALFASKNHRALDAVVPRLNGLSSGGPLVIRASNQDLALRKTWRETLREILSRPAIDQGDLAAALRARMRRHLADLTRIERQWEGVQVKRQAYETAGLKLREAEDRLVELDGDRGLIDVWREPEYSTLLARHGFRERRCCVVCYDLTWLADGGSVEALQCSNESSWPCN